MSLPTIKTVVDCTDFSKTVSPFIPQLYDLPQRVYETVTTNPQGLRELYLSTNPLISGFAFSLFLFPIFLVASEINKNYSQVDRFWSILPTLFNAHFVIYAHGIGLPTQRLDTLLAFSTVWSVRLTYNYWRKGGYTVGSEDYRWEVLRKYIRGPLWFLFNLLFISLAQSVLLFSVSMPTYVLLLAAKLPGKGLLTEDIVFSRVLVGLVILAYLGDQQQWNFQNAKKEYQKTGKVPANFHQEDLDRGFNVTGLWAWSRHPNFAAEQSVWVVLYLWSCFVSNTYYNWTGIGAILYLILFQASTWFTEIISAKKYPEYAEYQRRVGKFLPKFGSGPGDFSDKRAPSLDEAKTK
ncbi:hypothetical protein MMC24_004263 [Lignoscripta atroalba]|nr:hypothetical protein [Lignoscripta atroalba]